MVSNLIVGFGLGAVCGVLAYALLARRRLQTKEAAQRYQWEVAEREARIAWREKEANMELDFQRRETELERALSVRRDEVELRSRELDRRDKRAAAHESELAERENELLKERRLLEEAEHEAEKVRRLYRLKLHQITHMSREDARDLLVQSVERDCERELAAMRAKLLDRTEAEISEEARRILLASMQRITSQPMNDATATVVSLPSEEMKGRIIGRGPQHPNLRARDRDDANDRRNAGLGLDFLLRPGTSRSGPDRAGGALARWAHPSGQH